MTTLTQPSFFSLKILYACGASVSGSSCVITCTRKGWLRQIQLGCTVPC